MVIITLVIEIKKKIDMNAEMFYRIVVPFERTVSGWRLKRGGE